MVTRTITACISLLLLLALSSCAHDRNRYIPVFSTQPRVSTLGFSIEPPPGPGWYEKVSSRSLLYLKTIPAEDYVLFSRATELQFDHDLLRSEDLFDYVKNQKEADAASKHFKNNQYAFTRSTKAKTCIRYEHDFEDHYQDAPESGDSAVFVRVTSSGLFCVHPENPRVGIDLVYYQRTYPDNRNTLANEQEVERFLDSLVILPVNRSL